MRAYYLVMALIIFNLSLPVVSSLGFAAPAGTNPEDVFTVSWDWSEFLKSGLAMFVIGAAAAWVGLRVNIGALVFAAVFLVSNNFFSTTLGWLSTTYGLASSVVTLMTIGVWAVFIFAFIQLTSIPVEHD